VVEDNRDSAESLRRLLTIHGYDVTLAYTGTERVETAQRSRPDVVICDIGLPGMDGYAVANAIRQNPGTASASCGAISASKIHRAHRGATLDTRCHWLVETTGTCSRRGKVLALELYRDSQAPSIARWCWPWRKCPNFTSL